MSTPDGGQDGGPERSAEEAPRRRARRRWKVLGAITVIVAVVGGGAVAYANHRGWLRDTYLAAVRPCPDTPWTVEPAATDEARVTHVEPVAPGVVATDIAFASDGTGYVVTQRGLVHRWRDGEVSTEPVLDLTGTVSTEFDQGLLGAAVDPDGAWLHLLLTDAEGTSQLVAVGLDGDGDPEPDRQRVLLEVEQPDVYHNGGGLRFGPDGLLYASIGDGGLIGDPTDNAQSLDRRLGKVLRIEPTPGDDEPYLVPDDNPFVGDPDAAPEVWAYGMRNPFRIAFDDATGDLWVGDVGNNCVEDLTRIAAGTDGANLGWNRWEGTRKFVRDDPEDHVAPAFVYPHADGWCAVTGVAVYRGDDIAGLAGRMVFADMCVGALVAVELDGGRPVAATRLAGTVPAPLGLVAEPSGELLVLSQVDGVGRLVAGPAPEATTPVGAPDGARLFATHCAACHGADGGGNVGPAIGDGRTVDRFADPADQIEVVTGGRDGMPAFGERLDAAEIAEVVRYVRDDL
ncbi:MAG: PQQ-dependent sugar dehydrogenase [Actinomycetota bacterium]|nr:PQQ-dependent sugar dehydrogenase [Actinomycetota bacterium]